MSAQEDRVVSAAEEPIAATGGVDLVPAIAYRGVEHRFASPKRSWRGGAEPADRMAVTGVDLEVADGEFVALVGASGCGKTTLLNMAAGLVHPSTGTVTVAGREPRCPDSAIGYMFARDALLPWRTAEQNVSLTLEAQGWSRRRRRERAREMLDWVGLGQHADLYRLQLSQGMRQRVSLARTLAPDPTILLMDEPFAALDARTKLHMQQQFLEIWEGVAAAEDRRRSVLFVTHDLQEAVLLADRVVVMQPSPGRIAHQRTIDLPRPRAALLSDVMYSEEFRLLGRDLFERLEGATEGRTPAGGQEGPS